MSICGYLPEKLLCVQPAKRTRSYRRLCGRVMPAARVDGASAQRFPAAQVFDGTCRKLFSCMLARWMHHTSAALLPSFTRHESRKSESSSTFEMLSARTTTALYDVAMCCAT